jgi:hypothetical protein
VKTFFCLLVAIPAWAGPTRKDGPSEQPEPHEKKEDTDDEDKPKLQSDTPVVLEGPYQGVTLEGENLPPRAPALPQKGMQRMTWPGFQVKDGLPIVFIEVTDVPSYSIQEAPGKVVVTLKNTRVHLRNNRRPLKVGFFKTHITEIVTRERGKNVDVVILAKGKTKPTHHERTEAAAGGFHILRVELPTPD